MAKHRPVRKTRLGRNRSNVRGRSDNKRQHDTGPDAHHRPNPALYQLWRFKPAGKHARSRTPKQHRKTPPLLSSSQSIRIINWPESPDAHLSQGTLSYYSLMFAVSQNVC